MTRKKIVRTVPAAIDILDHLAFAAPDAPATDIDAILERQQHRCVDCGGDIENERDGVLCQACAEHEERREAAGRGQYRPLPRVCIRKDGPDYAFWFASAHQTVYGEAYQSRGEWFAFIQDGLCYGKGTTIHAAVTASLDKWEAQ